MALLCPLCMGGSTFSKETLLYNLVASATQQILCPFCSDILSGFDKFTVHLCSHILKCDTNDPLNISQDQNTSNLVKQVPVDKINYSDVEQNNATAAHHSATRNIENNSPKLDNYQHENQLTNEMEVLDSFKDLAIMNRVVDENVCEPRRSSEIYAGNIIYPIEVESSYASGNLCNDTSDGVVYGCNKSITIPSLVNCNLITSNEIDHEVVEKWLQGDTGRTKIKETILQTDLKEEKVPVPVGMGRNEIKVDQSQNAGEKDISIEGNDTVCVLCSHSFPNDEILSLHYELIHKGSSGMKRASGFRYQCNTCKKKFKMKGSMLIHQQLLHHTNDPEKSQLKSVVEDTLDTDSLQYNCQICFKVFKKEHYLNQHLRIHSEKQWSCDDCGKCFSTKYFLKKHKLLHTGEMPFTCTICNKQFTFQQSFHRHMLYHNCEKPHTCEECGKTFKELSTLYNHQRIHTGEKPYSCEICGKMFRQRVSYLVHRRIHTGSKPYKCNTCQKSFRYKVSIRSHKCIYPLDEESENLKNSE